MNVYLSTFLIVLLYFNTSFSQNCNDGILNGDETRVDCGGFFCPKCEYENIPQLQNVMTHTKLGATYDNATNATNIAVDSAGSRAIISVANTFSGYNSVFTAATDGSEFTEIFNFVTQAPGSGFATPMIDISRDGSTVLWTTGEGHIYVSDFNGENRRRVADKLKNQEDNSGEIELKTSTRPRFNSNGSAVVFTHSANGSKNRGIWEVGINQTIATNQLLNVENLSEAFTETIWNLGGNKHFFQLHITENNDIQFLTNLLNADQFDTDIMMLRDGNLDMLSKSAIYAPDVDGDQHTISKDGNSSFWINPSTSNAIYFKLDHSTNQITSVDLVRDLNAVHSAKRIYSNYDGSILLVSGTQSGGGSVQNVIVKENGEEYYPIHMAHGSLNNMKSIPAIIISDHNEKLVFTVGRGFPEPHEVWVTDMTPPSNNFDPRFPSIESHLFTNNSFIPRRLNNSIFRLNVIDGENEAVNKVLFSTFSDDTLHLGYYLDPDFGTQLYDDGVSFGDNAVDNRYEHDDIEYSGQGHASSRDLPYAFSVRFNLATTNYITSYDYYPFFMVDQVSATNELDDKKIHLYPTVLNASNMTINLKVDFSYKKASWQIIDISGRLLQKSPSLSKLSNIKTEGLASGIYFLMINIDNNVSTRKFVVQN